MLLGDCATLSGGLLCEDSELGFVIGSCGLEAGLVPICVFDAFRFNPDTYGLVQFLIA